MGRTVEMEKKPGKSVALTEEGTDPSVPKSPDVDEKNLKPEGGAGTISGEAFVEGGGGRPLRRKKGTITALGEYKRPNRSEAVDHWDKGHLARDGSMEIPANIGKRGNHSVPQERKGKETRA